MNEAVGRGKMTREAGAGDGDGDVDGDGEGERDEGCLPRMEEEKGMRGWWREAEGGGGGEGGGERGGEVKEEAWAWRTDEISRTCWILKEEELILNPMSFHEAITWTGAYLYLL